MKKVISLVCCTAIVASSLFATACGGDSNDTKTKIYVELKSGGTGIEWLEEVGKRFSDLKEQEVYEEGKQGVVIMPVPSDNPSIKNAETSGSAIFDLMEQPTIENEARAGKVLCIDDVLTDKSDMRDGTAISPLEKIPEEQRSRYMYDGHYYGGPTCEYYPTISYDKNLFDKYHLYLANPDAIADHLENDGDLVAHESDILGITYYFLPDNKNDNKAMMSCGPDGEYGTEDDGLPSSLYELIALCEYMKGKTISPFNFTGGYKYYSNFLCSAIYTALQGYERASANYNFTGEIEIITGFEDVELFNTASEIKKPITKTVELTEENGYYTTWGVEKYYAQAFMQLCVDNGWFGPSATNGDDQKAAMSKFVFSDSDGNAAKIAFLLDGSYWYNEATEGDNYFQMLEDSKYLVAGQYEERDVRVMPLPVNFSETVVEGEGKPQTLLEMNAGMFVINKNVEKNPGLMRACKEFLKFMYTDAELSAYTAGTSILRSMNYKLDSDGKAEISSFGSHLIDLINTDGNKVVYAIAQNPTFNANIASFRQTWTNAVFAVKGVPSLYEALTTEKKTDLSTVADIFKNTATTKASWNAMYKGSATVTDEDGLTSLIG